MSETTRFYLYSGLLTISGILMLAMAAIGFGLPAGARVVNALFGLGFTGYGGYLLLFFDGDEYRVFYYAFVVPVIMVIYAVRARRAQQQGQAAPGSAP